MLFSLRCPDARGHTPRRLEEAGGCEIPRNASGGPPAEIRE
jgi:hypothetical protein